MIEEEESVLLPKLARMLTKPFRTNGKDGKDAMDRLLEKICFGFSDCWFWFGSQDYSGYGRMNSLNEHFAHRVSWKIFKGDIPKGKKVLHKCDIRNCVNPDHLFLGTQNDNVQDMKNKGRVVSLGLPGEANPNSKLNEKTAREIREIHAKDKTPYPKLAKKYGVSTMTICRLINLQSWKNI